MLRKSVNLRNGIYAVLIVFSLFTYVHFIYPYRGNIFGLELPPHEEHKKITVIIIDSKTTHSNREVNKCEKNQLDLTEALKVLNLMGKRGVNLETLEKLLSNYSDASTHQFSSRMRGNYTHIMERAPQFSRKGNYESKENITIALVSCGSRRSEALVMLKSVTLFSQDAALHVILFGDKETILDAGQDILELKWTTNALGWDFTFELHLEWFPPDKMDVWRKMYIPCATERLFFPSLLPHIDSLIYMDTDILIVSNLTELWQHFKMNMKDTKLAALAANNEPTARGWYNTMAETPYYGSRGLNAGVMLMNLTRMRNFSFEAKSLAAHSLYREKLKLADQDIVNIIFNAFPEKLHVLDCSYNFNWVHCGHDKLYPCHNKTTGESHCFCNAAATNGVQVIHGNSHTFHSDFFHFLKHLYTEFEKFDLLTDSPKILFENLKTQFNAIQKPCHPLTSDILYRNAENYVANLQRMHEDLNSPLETTTII